MQWILALVIFLVGLGWIAVEYEPPLSGEPAVVESPWRRTANGWERVERWGQTSAPTPPALHPLLVAVFQTALSVAALVAFPSRHGSVS